MPRRDEGYFASRDGKRLFWWQLLPDGEPKAWLGFVHGYADHSGRYEKPIEHWVKQGFAVQAFDYRGHGKSDGARGDVGQWSDYLDDVGVFYGRLREAAQGKPLFLLSHSNGSLINTHFIAQTPLPELRGAVLVGPFYGLALPVPPLKLLAAKLVKGLAPGFKIGNELDPTHLSRDTAWQLESAQDPLRFATTTPRWFFETRAAQERLAGVGPKLKLPLLMVMGAEDPIASVPAARAFFDTIGSADKTLKLNEGHRHETLMEIGREQVWDDISSWISAHL